jgi:ribosomal protein L20
MKFLKLNSRDRSRDLSLSKLIITEKAEKFKLNRKVLIEKGNKPDTSQTSLFRKIDDITSLYL